MYENPGGHAPPPPSPPPPPPMLVTLFASCNEYEKEEKLIRNTINTLQQLPISITVF